MILSLINKNGKVKIMTNKTEDKTQVDKYKLSKKYLSEVDGFTAFKIKSARLKYINYF